MQPVLRLAVIFWAALAGMAAAQDKLVVVELFTSQGCSSCPPADKILTQLSGREDVIALAMHVDYWDYIGWKDSFADPIYTQRQKAYARAAGSRSVFTPQFIVGGKDTVIGAKAMDLADQIAAHARGDYAFDLQARRDSGQIAVTAKPGTAGSGREMVLRMLTYAPKQSVAIKRGENAGRTLDYSNVVTGMAEVARWQGQRPLTAKVKAPKGQAVVFLLQESKAGPIVGAVALR